MGGPLKKYTVVSPSGVETVMKLNEADARRYGVLEEPAAEEPEAEEATAPAKKRATSNKARAVANKDGGAGGGDD